MATFIKGTEPGCCPGCSSNACESPYRPTLTEQLAEVVVPKEAYAYEAYWTSPHRFFRTASLSGSAVGPCEPAPENLPCPDPEPGLCPTWREIHYSISGFLTFPDVEVSFSVSDFREVDGPGDCSEAGFYDSIPCGESFDLGGCFVASGYGSVSGSGNVITGYGYGGGTVTSTLGSEYLSSDLIADGLVELAAAGEYTIDDPDCTAFLAFGANEYTLALGRKRYKFSFPVLTPGMCYSIDWLEDGVAKRYEWDGVATETPWYYVDPPEAEGVAGVITNIVETCVCPEEP